MWKPTVQFSYTSVTAGKRYWNRKSCRRELFGKKVFIIVKKTRKPGNLLRSKQPHCDFAIWSSSYFWPYEAKFRHLKSTNTGCSLGNCPKRTNTSCPARALPALLKFPCCSPSGMVRRTAGNAVLPRHDPLRSRKQAHTFLCTSNLLAFYLFIPAPQSNPCRGKWTDKLGYLHGWQVPLPNIKAITSFWHVTAVLPRYPYRWPVLLFVMYGTST